MTSPAVDMLVGTRTMTVRAYDLAGNPSALSGGLDLEIVANLGGHADYVHDLSWSPDGSAPRSASTESPAVSAPRPAGLAGRP